MTPKAKPDLTALKGDFSMNLNRFTPDIRDSLQKLDVRRAKALKAQLEAEDETSSKLLAMYVLGVLHSMRDVSGENWEEDVSEGLKDNTDG